MKVIKTGDIRQEFYQMKTPEDFLRLVKKYPSRVLATVDISIDSTPFKGAPYVYFQDGELFIEY